MIGLLSGIAVMRYIRPAALPVSQPVVRFPIRLEPGQWLDGIALSPPYGFDRPTRTAMAISSDGRFIVYSGESRRILARRTNLACICAESTKWKPSPSPERKAA